MRTQHRAIVCFALLLFFLRFRLGGIRFGHFCLNERPRPPMGAAKNFMLISLTHANEGRAKLCAGEFDDFFVRYARRCVHDCFKLHDVILSSMFIVQCILGTFFRCVFCTWR